QVGGKRFWYEPVVLGLNPASNMSPGSPHIDVIDRGCQRLRDMTQEDWPDEPVRCRHTLAAQVLADQVVLIAQVLIAERRLESSVVEDPSRYSPGEFARSRPEAPPCLPLHQGDHVVGRHRAAVVDVGRIDVVTG